MLLYVENYLQENQQDLMSQFSYVCGLSVLGTLAQKILTTSVVKCSFLFCSVFLKSSHSLQLVYFKES